MSGRARNADEVGDMLRDIDDAHQNEREALEERIRVLNARIANLLNRLAAREFRK